MVDENSEIERLMDFHVERIVNKILELQERVIELEKRVDFIAEQMLGRVK